MNSSLLTIAEAARRTGKSRTTIYKAMKSGELSAVQDATGERRLDVSELIRAFGPMDGERPVQRPETSVPNVGERPDIKVLEIELATLRERTVQHEQRIRDLSEDRDRWRAQAESAQRLLTDQRGAQTAVDRVQQEMDRLREALDDARRPWWRRLFR